MKNRVYLITGGCGFIGSNFIEYIFNDNFSTSIINIDKMGVGSDIENIPKYIRDSDRYRFYQLNINNPEIIDILQHSKPNIIIHFAAESHVDRSINSPAEFINNNIIDAFWFLESVRKSCLHSQLNNFRIINVGTDEVYGSIGYGKSKENDTILPSSPYSASKAAAEAIMFSYHKTYDLPIIGVRCSNNYGPKQLPEKLIPLAIKKILHGDCVPIYGDGLQERDWLFVTDNCEAISRVAMHGISGWTYNIGIGNPITNLSAIEYVATELGYKLNEVIEYVDDRLGHDRRYSLDNSRIKNWIGWEPKTIFQEGIKQTIAWYKEKFGEEI